MDLPGAFNRSADPAPFPVAEGERNASPGSAGALVPARSVDAKLRRFFAAFEFLKPFPAKRDKKRWLFLGVHLISDFEKRLLRERRTLLRFPGQA